MLPDEQCGRQRLKGRSPPQEEEVKKMANGRGAGGGVTVGVGYGSCGGSWVWERIVRTPGHSHAKPQQRRRASALDDACVVEPGEGRLPRNRSNDSRIVGGCK